jgi:hypothetical protein
MEAGMRFGVKVLLGMALLSLPVSAGLSAQQAAAPAVPANRGGGPPGAEAVTFTRDIAPILQRSCQNCHRPDGVAPMALITY